MRFKASLQNASRAAAGALSMATRSTPVITTNAANTNVIPSLSPTVWQTVSTLSLPTGRSVTYRGWCHVEIVSNAVLTRLAAESISIRLLFSDGQTSGVQTVTFAAAGPYQWFYSRMLNTDTNVTVDMTSISVQILTGSSTSVVPLTIRSYLQLLPVPFRQVV
jgi:hypothetical protein